MENKDSNPSTIITSGEGDNGQSKRSSEGESFPGGRTEDLVFPPTTKAAIQREAEEGISVGEQLRRLLGPSYRWY